MGDVPDAHQGDPILTGQTVEEGIPFARPITLPYTAHPPSADPRAHEFLLLSSTTGAAWVDVARLILFLILLDLFSGVVMGIMVSVATGSQHPLPDWAETELERVLLIPTLALRAVGSMGIIAAILRHRGQSARSVGVTRRSSALNVLVGIGAVIVVYGLLFLMTPMLWLFWPGIVDQMEENAERLMEMVPKLHPLGFVPLAMTIGVYEELVFRGFLMTRLRRATGSWTVAVLVSSAVFTVLHALDQTAAALVLVTVLSLVFSLVTIWRRSLVPAIVAHALFDLSQFLLLYFTAGDAWT